MAESTAKFKKIVYLTFPPERSGLPVVCNLVKHYGLDFNILRADIGPRAVGTMTLELSGTEDNFHKGVAYLKENNVRITPVAQKVFRDEDSCIHCGLCTAMCPTRALTVHAETREIIFQVDKCSTCGLCAKICPVHAMSLDVEDSHRP